MSELERTGFRSPEVDGLERRSALRHREAGSRLGVLEASPLKDAKLLEDIELTTTPGRFRHGLGRPVKGALIVKRSAAAFDVIVTETQNDNVFAGLSVDVGTHTVNVLVF